MIIMNHGKSELSDGFSACPHVGGVILEIMHPWKKNFNCALLILEYENVRFFLFSLFLISRLFFTLFVMRH